MSWNLPGVRLEGRDDDDESECWRGVDEATGDELTVRRIRAAAVELDHATWRSAALQAIGHRGLLAPRRIVAVDDDLVVVYDRTRPIGAPRPGAGPTAAIIATVAEQLHALHAAGMTHGQVGAATVRRDAAGDPVLLGSVESALRTGGDDDTSADDVRALAAFGLSLLHSVPGNRTHESTGGLRAVLAVAGERPETTDPCDPAPSADLARQCAPYASDEPGASDDPGEPHQQCEPADARPEHDRPGSVRAGAAGTPVRGAGAGRAYVARHRYAPPRRRRRSAARSRGAMSGPAAAGAVISVLIAVCAWIGTVWGEGGGSHPSPIRMAAGSAAQSTAHPVPGGPTPGFDAHSASLQQWADYLRGLYALRATAILDRTGELLDGVYVPGSPQRESDLAVIAALTSSGTAIVGLAPEIVAVQEVSHHGGTVEVRLIDRLPPYTIVGADGTPTSQAGRGDRQVSVSLERVGGHWLVSSAVRAA